MVHVLTDNAEFGHFTSSRGATKLRIKDRGPCGDAEPISFLSTSSGIRELRQRKRRRRGRRLVKNEFLFHKRNLRVFRSVQYANGSKHLLRLNM